MRPAKRVISAGVIPASSGRPGPGEIRILLGSFASISSSVVSIVPAHYDVLAKLARVLDQVVK